jgi:hypothetical protein
VTDDEDTKTASPAQRFQIEADKHARKAQFYSRLALWHRLGKPEGFFDEAAYPLPDTDGITVGEALGEVASMFVRSLMTPRKGEPELPAEPPPEPEAQLLASQNGRRFPWTGWGN